MINPNTPVQEVSLVEVSNANELREALRRGLDYGLPGFAIRAAYSQLADDEKVIGALSQLTGQSYRLGYVQQKVSAIVSRTSAGIGRLHDDVMENDNPTEPSINVHRTITGAGKVTLANAGPKYLTRNDESYYQMLKEIGDNLAEGSVDSKLILPKVYTTSVSAGDIIVFPTVTRLGATLHRFDTSEGPRDASATIFESVDAR